MESDHYTIEAQSVDWIYVMGRLLRPYNPKSGEDVTVLLDSPYGFASYQIRKDFIPADVLAKTFGLPAEKVEKAEKITLPPITACATWQRPTVNYVGEA